jgi:ureidoacrylate peracid hydrolase
LETKEIMLRRQYRLPGRLPDFSLRREKAAVLVVDLQYLDAHEDGAYGRRAREQGVDLSWYFSRLANTVIPSVKRVIEAGREAGLPIIFVRIACQDPNGSDAGWRFKEFGNIAPLDSLEARFLDELQPEEGDYIIDKTTASAFNSSSIDYTLRSLGVSQLVVAGVATNGCVESTIRDAADLSYQVFLVEDGCATLTEVQHNAAINAMDYSFALVKSSDQIVKMIKG